MAMRRSVFSAGLLALMALSLGNKPGSAKINDAAFDNPEGRERWLKQKAADEANRAKFPSAKKRKRLGLAKPVHIHQDHHVARYRRKVLTPAEAFTRYEKFHPKARRAVAVAV